ncbi:hypothetical protein ACFYY8_31450 [Streptosporangium sp. NPDC001559]|uniref:hypothetical protein n=1 Tax=Streptosporangium sp. NPDC001559 TaxID=3366187 RepID=UPI0036E999F4
MNANRIAEEIARLSALLPEAITSGDDVDAIVGHLADAQRDQAKALDQIAEMTAAKPLLDRILRETRGSNVLRTLGLVPAARPA